MCKKKKNQKSEDEFNLTQSRIRMFGMNSKFIATLIRTHTPLQHCFIGHIYIDYNIFIILSLVSTVARYQGIFM